MRAVIQRVSRASVAVGKELTGSIGKGLAVLLGIEPGDGPDDLRFITRKLLNLRIFSDQEGKFNLSLLDVKGEILLISQFTLYGDCRRGNRPSFSRAAPPATAEELYEELKRMLEGSGVKAACGVFGAHMEVSLVNDGPVTLILDSRKEVY